MALLVVPLGVDELDHLTLGELDAIRVRGRVLFEHPEHPLAERLAAEGVDVAALDGVDLSSYDWAVVLDPDQARISELVAGGAEVTAGLAVPPDALSAARGAYLARRSQRALGTLALVMARLRGPDGCPWDAQQTHESLEPHLLEEAHEVLEAIDKGLTGTELEEELGDLLLQVVFHAQLAADDGRFDLAGVADAIVAKLIRRHPHVFGDVAVTGADEVIRNWETIKATEGKAEPAGGSAFDGIPAGLPALVLASKTLKRSATAIQPDAAEATRRVEEALRDGDLGAGLFWLVALARAGGADAEGALRRFTYEFQERMDEQ